MYLTAPLARADRIQTGIQSVIYMKGQDFSFVYQFGYLRTETYCVFIWKFLDILISGCSRRNIVKQTDVSILWIHEKKWNFLVPDLHKLEGKFFHTYKMHFYLLITTWYALTFNLSAEFVRRAFYLWFLLISYDDM